MESLGSGRGPPDAPFLQGLAQGLPRSEAQRQAKLEFYPSGGSFSHPAHWVAFVLNGEGNRPLPLPWSWSALLIAAAVSLAVVGLAVRLAARIQSTN